MRGARGYILVETLVSMALLSISMLGIHQVIQQSIQSKALARDYTTVRFLMEGLAADLEMQEYVHEMREEGTFEAPHERFEYVLEISKVEVPRPELPLSIEGPEREQLEKQYKGYMPKVRIEISWERAGNRRTRVAETMFNPIRLWLPPELDANGNPIQNF